MTALAGIVGTWIVLALALIGLGRLVRSLCGPKSSSIRDVFDDVWMGFVVGLLLLQVWHLFLPITWHTTAAIGGLGLGGLAVTEDWRRDHLRRIRDPQLAVLILAISLYGVWVAVQALGPMVLFDTGLYHLPFVEWAKSYKLVPGLGNLHGRLGFNSANFLYAAALDQGFWSGGAHHVANGFLVVAIGSQAIRSGAQIILQGGRAARWFDLWLLIPVVFLTSDRYLTSFSTDLAVTLLMFAAASRLCRFATERARPPEALRYELVLISGLLVAGVCVKLTVGAFAGMGLVLLWLVGARGVGKPDRRTVVVAATLSVLLAGTWAVRGVILTGYPAYPISVAGFPVDWRVPAAQVHAEAAWTAHGERLLSDPGLPYERSRLFSGSWLRVRGRGLLYPRTDRTGNRGLVVNRTFWRVWVPAIIVILGVLLYYVRRRANRGAATRAPPPRVPDAWSLLIWPAVVGILFWLFTVPGPRRGVFSRWILASAVASREMSRWKLESRRIRTGAVVGCLLLALLSPEYPTRSSGSALERLRDGVRLAVEGHPGLKTVPPADLESYETESGLRLFVPRESNACWRAPLPCTPYPAPNLELREPGRLASGFRTRGPWEPLRWPFPGSDFLDSYLRHHRD